MAQKPQEEAGLSAPRCWHSDTRSKPLVSRLYRKNMPRVKPLTLWCSFKRRCKRVRGNGAPECPEEGRRCSGEQSCWVCPALALPSGASWFPAARRAPLRGEAEARRAGKHLVGAAHTRLQTPQRVALQFMRLPTPHKGHMEQPRGGAWEVLPTQNPPRCPSSILGSRPSLRSSQPWEHRGREPGAHP